MKSLLEIQNLVFQEYKNNDYLEEWTFKPYKSINSYKGINSSEQKIYDIAELGLIMTEISEAIEEIRKKETDLNKLGLECADIIIRTLNFMSRKCIIAEYFIISKNSVNEKRKKLHGKGV